MARPITSQCFKNLMDSDEFKNSHKSAKDVIKNTLYALDKQGNISDSDYMICIILISNFDLFFRLKDQLLKGELVYKDGRNKDKNAVCINPIFQKLSSLSTSCTQILEKLGGSTASRRRLSTKEMSQAENCVLDNILNENTNDRGFNEMDY